MRLWRIVNLFTPAEVHRAFAALQRNSETLYGVSDGNNPLHPFVRRRGGAGGYRRDHIELPLRHMYEDNTVYQQLPAEVRLVCTGLHEAALSYVQEALREGSCISSAVRDEILKNLGRKSVLRVLRYPVGSGCRPHVDPGLCTALLVGSAGGLEVGRADPAATHGSTRLEGSATHSGSLPAFLSKETSKMRAALPHWESVVTAHIGEAVVMAGNMLGVVSGGALPGVLHRVRQDWDADTPQRGELFNALVPRGCTASEVGTEGHAGREAYRFNVIVELRPEDAKRCYAAAARHSSIISVAPKSIVQ